MTAAIQCASNCRHRLPGSPSKKEIGADLWSSLWGRSSRLLASRQRVVKAAIIVGLDIQVLMHGVADFELHRHRHRYRSVS